MKIITILLGAYLLFLLEQYLYNHFWNKNLTVVLSLSNEKATEGDELILYETVINKKLLPLPIIKVKFMTSKYFKFLDTTNSSVTDNYYRNDLLYIMMYQKLTRSLPFMCNHRGYFTINRLDVVCCDMFLSFETVEKYDLNLHLYVYPKQVDYNKFQIPFQKMLGTVLTKRFINEDPFEFRSIREYQTYDNLKSINWKSSAKTGSLKVNMNDYTSSQQIQIVLNLESDTMWIYDDVLEESIRIAATFATAFIEQGLPTSIYANARDVITKELINVPAGSGNNHVRTLNETLSRIDTLQDIPAFVPLFQDELIHASENTYIIIISCYQKIDLQLLLSTMLQRKTDFIWIFPFNNEIQQDIKEELLPYVMPWKVEKII